MGDGPIVIDGIVMNLKEIDSLRRQLIALRDGAFEVGRLDWAGTLSIAIGFLYETIQRMAKAQEGTNDE